MATTLGAVAEGSIVYLNESGVAVPFYVAKHNYESALNGDGRTLLVRKDAWPTAMAWDTGGVNAYSGSDIDIWLNGTYKTLLDSFVQTAMEATTFYYTPGNGNTTVTTLSRAAFALSLTEYGVSASNANAEGGALPTASTIRGSATKWTRTPSTSDATKAFYQEVNWSGTGACTIADKVQPAITMPATQSVDDNNNVTEGSGGGSGSTKEYTRLEYIRATGTQLINTNYTPNQNTKAVVRVSADNGSFFAGTTSNATGRFGVYLINTGKLDIAFGSSGYVGGIITGVTNPADITLQNGSVTANGTTGSFTTQSAFTSSGTIQIFISNSYGTLYSFKIYDNNTLVRDFIPARRNSDGAVGLLDQANNVFYGNAGTGTFTAGPVAEYTQVEWIQGTGTQYINTGISAKDITKVEIGIIPQSDGLAGDPIYGAEWGANGYFLIFYQQALRFHSFGGSVDVNYNVGVENEIITTQTTITSNGVDYNVGSTGPNTSNTFLLFQCNGLCGKFKLTYCRIYVNGSLVRDYIGAVRSDGTVGLLDKENNTFYTNAGTGAFKAGPEIIIAQSAVFVDDTSYPVVQGYIEVDDIRYSVPFYRVLIDGIVYEGEIGGGEAQPSDTFTITASNSQIVCDLGDGILLRPSEQTVVVESGAEVAIGCTGGAYVAADATVNGTKATVYTAKYDSSNCYMTDLIVTGDITVALSVASMRGQLTITMA